MTWTELTKKRGLTKETALWAFGHHDQVQECPSRAWLFRSICRTTWKKFAWHPWAVKASEALGNHDILGMHGVANSSKSDIGALWAIVNWWANPKNTLILVTSTTIKDSKKRMWGRIRHYIQTAEGIPDIPGKVLETSVRTVIDGIELPENCGIHLIAGEKKKESEAVGKMIGLKNEVVIVVADELPELSHALFEAYRSNIAMNLSTARAEECTQFVGIGNFASIYDALGEVCRPKLGWGAISVDDDEWETECGWCIRFDGLKSPNFEQEKDLWPFIYNRKMLASHKRTLKENSISFWRMCRSYPCPIGVEDTIYSEADIITGKASESCEFDDPGSVIKVAAHDPAFTHEGDRAPLIFGSFGKVKKLPTLRVDDLVLLREDVTNPSPRDIQIAQKLKEECLKRQIAPENLGVDGTGSGMTFISLIHQMWSPGVLAVMFGGAASDRPIFVHDPRPAHELYANRVTEIWTCGREYMRSGQLRGIPEEVARQMKSRKYTTVKGITMKTKVESKVDLKQRLLYSPDESDAYFIMLDLCRERFGFLAETGSNSFASLRVTFRQRAFAADEVYHELYTGD